MRQVETRHTRDAGTGARLATFSRQVRDALAHLNDPTYLQANPLTRFVAPPPTARQAGSGRLLRETLLAAIEALRPERDVPPSDHAWRGYDLLTLRFVEGLDVPTVTDRLAISRAELFRDQRQALDAIAVWLSVRWGTADAAVVPPRPVATAAEPPTTTPPTFGDLLRRYRLAAGLTQEELAEHSRLSPRAISDLERGARNRPWRDTVQLLADALRLEASGRAELEEAARRARPSAAEVVRDGTHDDAHGPRTNLPIQLTSFVGRERELAEVRQLLTTTRLLTLTGAGGCGKTRLALQVAAGLLDAFADGVWLVDLAPLNDPALVPQAVALALGIREAPDHPLLTTLAEALRARHLLLLLDNCEHLLDACTSLTSALLQTCGEVRILATSREMLGAQGEAIWRVPSLAFPEFEVSPSPEEVRQNEAVRLFVDRARAVAPDFAVTRANAPALAQVCRRLDGIPLALELAAARARVLSVEQIAARLDDRFRLLTGGSRTALRRQQTLRALIDWSHDLLSAAERVLFRRLAVFAGGWTLEAAEAVGAGVGIERDEILDLLTGLVDKSLVSVGSQDGEQRYRFLETVRAYAGDKLFEAGEARPLRDRHLAWCLALAEQAEPELYGPASRAWLDRLEGDDANLRVALDWCLETDPGAGLRLAGSLWGYWFLRGQLVEGTRWLGAILARAPEGAAARGKVLLGAGFCARSHRTLSQSRSWTEQSLAIARATGDRRLAGWALHAFGTILILERDFASARVVLEESVAECRQVADKVGEGMSLRDLGHLARVAGDDDRAAALYDEALTILRRVGHRWNIRWTLLAIGYLARQQHDPGRARATLQEFLATGREDRDAFSIAVSQIALGQLERSVGNYEEAGAYLKAGLRWVNTGGQLQHDDALLFAYATLLLQRGFYVRGVRLAAAAPPSARNPVNTLPDDLVDHDAALQTARGALGDAAFAAAWAEGEAMSQAQAIADALEGEEG
jgi:non-specific serine/threonine protein kinase